MGKIDDEILKLEKEMGILAHERAKLVSARDYTKYAVDVEFAKLKAQIDEVNYMISYKEGKLNQFKGMKG